MRGYQEQICEDGKAQNEQYLAGWVGLLHLTSELASLAI